MDKSKKFGSINAAMNGSDDAVVLKTDRLLREAGRHDLSRGFRSCHMSTALLAGGSGELRRRCRNYLKMARDGSLLSGNTT